MKLDATAVQLQSEITRTSDGDRRRYCENKQWRYHPKEWIYRKHSLAGKDVLDFGCGTGEISTQVAFLGAAFAVLHHCFPWQATSPNRRWSISTSSLPRGRGSVTN
jgi:SAM-dependent methyltransferase